MPMPEAIITAGRARSSRKWPRGAVRRTVSPGVSARKARLNSLSERCTAKSRWGTRRAAGDGHRAGKIITEDDAHRLAGDKRYLRRFLNSDCAGHDARRPDVEHTGGVSSSKRKPPHLNTREAPWTTAVKAALFRTLNPNPTAHAFLPPIRFP